MRHPVTMWHTGLLDLSIWQLIATTLLLTHVTIVSVTVYLHRYWRIARWSCTRRSSTSSVSGCG